MPFKGASKSNVQRVGKQVIQDTASEVRDSLKGIKGSPVLLHFDGNIIKESTKERKLQSDRLAVSINCIGENTILGIPPCLQATGECQTEVVIQLLELYELKDDIKGLVFETTAVNVGREKGVCTRINEYLGRPILHLACSHHVYECHKKCIQDLQTNLWTRTSSVQEATKRVSQSQH